MFFTVFTPTYNRAHTLSRAYTSLKGQTFKDFEWLIVDDGSADPTQDLIREWEKEGILTIRYFYQQNSGKHVAYNLAIEKAAGLIFVTLDSDDWFLKDSLSIAHDDWVSLQDTESNKIAGLRYLSCFANGDILGNKFPFDTIDGKIFDINDRFGIHGDKQNYVLSSVAARYPFPVFSGEFFCPEGLVWNRISKDFFFRHINKAIQVVEYQTDGLSANILFIRKQSMRGTILYYSEAAQLPISKLATIRNCSNIFRFCLHNKEKIPHSVWKISLLSVATGALIGCLLYCKDHIKAR